MNARTKGSLINEIMILKEDLECVHMWLDQYNIPRTLKDNEYSIVGRVQILLANSKN